MSTPIQYETRKLEAQYPEIVLSVARAIENSQKKFYARILGLRENAPDELWQYAVPHLDLDLKDPVHLEWRRRLGKPTIREAVCALAARKDTDIDFIANVETAFKIHKRGKISPSDCSASTKDNTERFLEANWVTGLFNRESETIIYDRTGPGFFQKSLCFYSDIALAKLLYYMKHRSQPAPHQVHVEAERVKKRYRRLGLIPARPRIIRDIEFRRENGQDLLKYVVIEERLPKPPKKGQS